MLVNECGAWLRSQVQPESALGFSFGVRAQTESKIWCVTGMYMGKVVSSEKNLGVKGFKHCTLAALKFADDHLKVGTLLIGII